MKTFIRSFTVGVFFLLLGMSTSNAQEVVFGTGPSISPATPPGNQGFAWGDVDSSGTLDVFIPANNILINTVAGAVSTFTQKSNSIPSDANAVASMLVDFTGDGLPEAVVADGSAPKIYQDSAKGNFVAYKGALGDLGSAGASINNFGGFTAADINRSGYLSLAWAGSPVAAKNGSDSIPGGIWLLKGTSTGFVNAGRRATAANLAIDTLRSFESWNPQFVYSTNSGYPDLFVPSFRNGLIAIDTGATPGRKGSILYINDGTGKFKVPNTYNGSSTIYSIGAGGVVGTTPDTGLVVDDTVRHYSAIASTWGDFNNDGIPDLIISGATDANATTVLLQGNGDGTFHRITGSGLPVDGSIRAISVGDYQNDGFEDILFMGSGGAETQLWKNNGNWTFTNETSADLPAQSTPYRSGQFVDWNSDGFLDIYGSYGAANVQLQNQKNSNHWIGFRPIGTGSNVSAVGARFTIYTGATKQIRDISANAGAEGMGGTLAANFGLGATTTKIDSVNVRWPDGTSHTYVWGAANNAIAVDKYYIVQEGSVIPSQPASVRPSWIAAHDTSLTSTDTLNWNRAVSGAGLTTYQVQIASNLSFASIVKTISSLTDTSTIVRLGLSTKYYWRVQAFDGQLPGAYSAIDSFRTKIQPDTVIPKQLLPAVNSITVANKPTLVVSYVPTASTYHFQVRSDSAKGFSNTSGWVVNDSTNDFDTTFAITTALTPSHKYYWRVRGYNPAGSSAFSTVDSFTIMFLPATPGKVYPSANQANVTANPLVLKWNHEAGDSNFVVQLWTFTNGGQVLRVDTTKHDTSWSISSGILNRAYYYWKVQCFNQGGASAYSVVDSFTTVIEKAVPPQAISPKGNTDPNTGGGWPRHSVFVWNPAVNAESYHLQVASANDFSTQSNIIYDATTTDTTLTIPDTLTAGTQYFYRLSSINLGGEGAFSSVAPYRTGTGVDAVRGLSGELPKEFALYQNYPNPFNPSTVIRYDIPKNAYVQVVIYDVLGRQVEKLVDGMQSGGTYNIHWSPSRLSSGIYFCRIQARSQDGAINFNSVKKLLYMK